MEKIKWSIDKAREEFEKRGLTLLETTFKSVDTKMKCIALCGHEKELSLYNLLIGKGLKCRRCKLVENSQKRIFSYEYVYNIFKESGCLLLSKEYTSSLKSLEYIARCGHKNYITLAHFKSGQGRLCRICSKPRGEKHHAFNPDLSDDERYNNRDYYEIILWRLKVYEKDGYKCQLCGDDKGGNLNAHHLNGYNWDIENRLNVDNGVTLCKKCHDLFHKNYGYGNNTIEQYKELISEYRGKPIDSERL